MYKSSYRPNTNKQSLKPDIHEGDRNFYWPTHCKNVSCFPVTEGRNSDSAYNNPNEGKATICKGSCPYSAFTTGLIPSGWHLEQKYIDQINMYGNNSSNVISKLSKQALPICLNTHQNGIELLGCVMHLSSANSRMNNVYIMHIFVIFLLSSANGQLPSWTLYNIC